MVYQSPPPYSSTIRPSEMDSLMPGKASRRRSVSITQCILTALLAVTVTIIIFASVFPLRYCNDPVDPAVRDRIRKEWDIERHQHQEEVLRRENEERNARRVQWEREAEEHKRAIEDRERREREERFRLNIHWTDPESHACATYGTREYIARLVNIPTDYNRRIEACMAMPIRIHGVEYKAKWCEDHSPSHVIGHWEVNQHEPECTSFWNSYKDLGCVSPGSGQRRVEQYLKNVPRGGDWMEFCATTPTSFRGMHFMGAQFCLEKNLGMYGQWDFDDDSCN